MGFEAYDYVLSKVDWLAAGLPTERAEPAPPRVLRAVATDVATCRPDERVEEVRRRIGGGECLVLNEERVVLGRLRLDRDDPTDGTAEERMHPGPTTIRADADLAETLERIRTRGVSSIIVTNPDGGLLGVLHA